MLQITGIHIYPVKSLAGISLTSAIAGRRGFRYDRRWMVVTPDGMFLTQREYPAMALIGTSIDSPNLVLFDRQNSSDRISVPLQITTEGLSEMEVEVWEQRCTAVPVSDGADRWLSAKLGVSVRLVGMPDSSIRPVDSRYAPEDQYVSFADGYPYLMIGEASLASLNSRLDSPVPMERFRPNIVFSGGEPFSEDQLTDFRIGNQHFRGVKPCARCIMTTIDQQTTMKNAEPLRTLSAYRKNGNKVLFGQNVVWMGNDANAVINVGDVIH